MAAQSGPPGDAGAAGQRPAVAEPPVAADIVDVWSRTQPKYRIRAAILLLVNLGLFCGLCAFMHWLHVGRTLEFTWSSYLAPAHFWGPQTQNLNDFLLYPINVQQTRVHGIVLGLLFASIVAIPIVVSILYRFGSALPFIAAVLVFAHMPGMAITLLAGCVLASVRPFRMSFRYGSTLVAMLPVLVYLYLATRGVPERMSGVTSPIQQSLLIAPWVLAILAACAMMAAVLVIARFVNYRPGAVAPVMGVMFAAPMALFHFQVGVDELSYRVLEAEYGPHSRRFEPARDLEDDIRVLISRVTEFRPQRSELLAILHGQVEELNRRVRHRVMRQYLTDRREAYEACKRFIADHPDSRYEPNVLYIQARALDTRLDDRRIPDLHRALYPDFPHVQSEAVWRPLWNKHADSPLSIEAGLRLAQLHVRRGQVDAALELLAKLRRRAERMDSQRAATQPANRGLLGAAPPESSLDFEPDPYVFEARRLAELLSANKDDPKYGVDPLRKLAGLDPRRARYRDQLLRLAQRYPDSALHENLIVRWAGGEQDHKKRAELLEGCVARFAGRDGLPEAVFQLAVLEIEALNGDEDSFRERGIARLRDLVQRFGATCWGQAAAQRLRMHEPQVARSTDVKVRP